MLGRGAQLVQHLGEFAKRIGHWLRRCRGGREEVGLRGESGHWASLAPTDLLCETKVAGESVRPAKSGRMTILSDYLGEIARIRATRAGTGEISYYGALAGAFNAVGATLKPRVF